MTELEEFKIPQINIDINHLFNLSYSFDNLKSFMKSLLKNQNLMSEKINELNAKLKEQSDELKKQQTHNEKKFKLLEVTILNVKKPSNTKSKDTKETKEIKEEIKPPETKQELNQSDNKPNENSQENINNDSNAINTQQKNRNQVNQVYKSIQSNKTNTEEDGVEEYEFGGANNEILKLEMEEMKTKIEELENKIKPLELNNKFTPNKIVQNNEENEMLKLSVQNLKEKFEELKTENDAMNKKIEEISVKVMDFNIYELFKDCKMEDGGIDASKLLVMNLEQKILKKFQTNDDKIKKVEEDMYKLKNDFVNVKNQADVINHSLVGFKETVKEIGEQVQKTNDDNTNMVNEMGNKVNENYKKILQKIEEEKNNTKKSIDKINSRIKKILSSEKVDEANNINENKGLSDSDIKLLADLNKRISDVEKQMKIILTSLDFSKIKEDMAKLENELMQKVNQKDYFELGDKLNLQSTITNNLREMVDRTQDLCNKNMKDLNFFLRKIESLSASVVTMKAALEALAGVKQENLFDTSRFMEISAFSEFIKNYNKANEKSEKMIQELRRVMNDMNDVLKSKASEEDMKTFEQIIGNKIDEMKLLNARKFADKMDTSKSMKYLDAQIKHITEVYIKRMDKGDSWLIAKKPINGFTCASCEAYIGELKEKGDYLAWNKYPQREKEKNYRIGNGFSRMLNMLNLDLKNNMDSFKENSYESDDDARHNYGSTQINVKACSKIGSGNVSQCNINNNTSFANFNKSNVLPRIKQNGGTENISPTHENQIQILDQGFVQNNAPMTEMVNNINDGVKNPHIVKVFRKGK